jgi:hypothetical protein
MSLDRIEAIFSLNPSLSPGGFSLLKERLLTHLENVF